MELLNIIDNWTDEPYMNILLYQYENTRHIIDKLDKLKEQSKVISASHVIGLLQSKLNNAIIEKYGTVNYLIGLYNLLKHYDVKRDDILIIKKSWLKTKYRTEILSITFSEFSD